jgi:pyruvate, orthophosphate dikinase
LRRQTAFLDEGIASDPELVGGKAVSLARMRSLGLRVPPAFVVTAEACRAYFRNGRLDTALRSEIERAISRLEEETERRFGGAKRPLLVSVRSGAAVSMPGMMDTVLDLGMNPRVEAALEREGGGRRFAAETHARFRELFRRIVLKRPDAPLPDDPIEQLLLAVIAVFESSRSRRARAYRKRHDLPDDLPTAVTVQAMVFGNLDGHSGTGVLFTRNPATGEAKPFGEFLACAQGEDVVSGTRTPEPIERLAEALPDVYAELLAAGRILEEAEQDVQDIEFTVERGTLWLLQARSAKRSADAAIRIAVELANEGKIAREDAIRRVTSEQVRAVQRPRLRDEARRSALLLTRGEAASPGVGAGVAVEDCDETESRSAAGERIVLVRPTTSPQDLHGMIAAEAIVTEVGGTTSHAAIVSRSLHKPCVVGCGEGTIAALVGRSVTVDGSHGEVFDGLLTVETFRTDSHRWLAQLDAWAGGRLLHQLDE